MSSAVKGSHCRVSEQRSDMTKHIFKGSLWLLKLTTECRGKQGGRKETRWEGTAVTRVRDDADMDQGGSSGSGEKSFDSKYIIKVEPM